jgi:hypothetical protein
MKLKTTTVQIVVMLLVLLVPALVNAQPPGFGGGDDVLDVPVDGGLSVLIAAGVGYGAKKLKNRKKS